MICSLWDISLADTIVFGNNYNDGVYYALLKIGFIMHFLRDDIYHVLLGMRLMKELEVVKK